ncbi:MAG: hypothetical protein O7C66_08985 [Alphaproteobacteria bacterium]|nr:hypothetical protein [Alphaproteobacteria bacterium]
MRMRHADHLVVTAEVCREAGLEGQYQRQRAVETLAKTGLFEVERHRGRRPVVRISARQPATHHETRRGGLVS